MRSTIDLPEVLHQQVRFIARDSERSMSQVIAELTRKDLRPSSESAQDVTTDDLTSLPLLNSGRPITTEMVREREDDW